MKVLLIIIVRNATSHLPRLFEELNKQPLGQQSEILFIDDASSDHTYDQAQSFFKKHRELQGHLLRNNIPQGVGGNQKVGLRYAIDHAFDAVAVFYPEDGYSCGDVATLYKVFQSQSDIACVTGTPNFFGSKFFNIMLNVISGWNLKDWSTSCRIYSVASLKQILFELNSHQRQFDVEILLQLLDLKMRVVEKPLQFSQSSVYSSQSIKTVINSLKVTLRYRLQRYHLFYDIRFHPELLIKNQNTAEASSVYTEKISMESPHTAVVTDEKLVPQGANVLDVGCATGYVAEALRMKKNCTVTGIDMLESSAVKPRIDDYYQINLESDNSTIPHLLLEKDFDVVMMLDVLEHLSFPEIFLLHAFRIPLKKSPKYIFSTANVAFIFVRILLLFGIFNYGTKGILDVTHKRLFTVRTFRNLMEQTGFIITGKRFFPFPFAMLGLPGWLCGILKTVNKILIRISPSLFAYQILFETVPLASPQKVLEDVIG